MHCHAFVLADQDRVEQFAAIGSSWRPFGQAESWTDEQGVPWVGGRLGSHCLAVTPLGAAWMFDPVARQARLGEYSSLLAAYKKGGEEERESAKRKAIEAMRLGGIAERLLWAVHAHALRDRHSVARVPDTWLAQAAWGERAAWPRPWRWELLEALKGLSWLHVAAWPQDGKPKLGEGSALISRVGDLKGEEDDGCDEGCPAQGPHCHINITLGKGFLGRLEQFAKPSDGACDREYEFPVGGPKGKKATLKKAGRCGRLVSVYLPAKLGTPSACKSLAPSQHALIQAVVREATRPTRAEHKAGGTAVKEAGLPKMAVISDGLVPDVWGNAPVPCPFLKDGKEYVGFNGNRKFHGRGYRLGWPAIGWLVKSGRSPDDPAGVLPLFDDFGALESALGLTVAGIHGSPAKWLPLKDLRDIATANPRSRTLASIHLRAYAEAGYLEKWNAYFGWGQPVAPPDCEAGGNGSEDLELVIGRFRTATAAKDMTLRAWANANDVDSSFLTKVLKGKKSPPPKLLDKLLAFAAGIAESENPDMLAEALAYLARGWSVVPQKMGEKRPHVNWKQYQSERPKAATVEWWYGKWQDAGIGGVLGYLSGLFLIDVDGPEAHAVLIERLGKEPTAPKAISGSRRPLRYHLFFKHPDLPTKAKQTPWHPQLEFKGEGGLIILPPSLHKSGNRYAWVPGRSPLDIALPPVPPQVLEALAPAKAPKAFLATKAGKPRPVKGVDASPRTLDFLSGAHSEGPGWNDKLFEAACDLHGRGMALAKAEPLLLNGAKSWNIGEEELAKKTIQSAYSSPRQPGRL